MHPIKFRLQESGTNATVVPFGYNQVGVDAIFGGTLLSDYRIKLEVDLKSGLLTVPHIATVIINDLVPEDKKCFTLRILPVDIPGRRELFTCNEDGVVADNYFCEHTICIEDDDGESFVMDTDYVNAWTN